MSFTVNTVQTSSASTDINKVIFIDAAVPNIDQLISGLPKDAVIVMLEDDSDGLEQIASYLQDERDIDAIQIISHGSDGALYLGNTILNDTTITSHTETLAKIGASLSSEGDVLLYGCDVAATDLGKNFVSSLSQALGADVAASDDLTGWSELNGDWDLEFATGDIDEAASLSTSDMQAYHETLGALANSSVAITSGGTEVMSAQPVGSGVEQDLGASNIDFDVDDTNNTITITLRNGVQWAVSDFGAVFSGGNLDQFTSISLTGGTALNAGSYSAQINSNKEITFFVPDGESGDGTIIFTYAATETAAANSAPSATGIPTDISAVEDLASDVYLATVALSDSDGDSLTVTLAATAGTFSAVSSGGGVTVSGSGTSNLTLSGTAENINSFLDDATNIQYTGASNATGVDAASFSISANDGTVNKTLGTVNISIANIMDAPTLTASATNPQYIEGKVAVDLYSSVSIDTIEANQTISEMSLSLTGLSDGSDEIISFDGTDIVLTNGTTGTTANNGIAYEVGAVDSVAVIAFTGASVSSATMAGMIDAMGYRNTSENPTTSVSRTIKISSLTDSGSDSGVNENHSTPNITSTVNVVGVNDAPELTNIKGSISEIIIGDGATDLSKLNGVTVTNVDTSSYLGGTLTIYQNSGIENGSWGVDGTTVTSGADGVIASSDLMFVGGIPVAVVDSSDDGQNGNTLELALQSSATNEQIQTLIRSLTYQAASNAEHRSFSLVLTDGGGTANGGTNTATANFGIDVINPAAIVSNLDGDSVSVTKNQIVNIDAGGNSAITDGALSNFDTGTLTISRTSALSGDFSLSGTGSTGVSAGASTATADGTIEMHENIYLDGVEIASVQLANDGQGTNDLILTLNANATPAALNQLLQALQFSSQDEGTHSFDLTVKGSTYSVTSDASSFSVKIDAPTSGGGGVVTPPDDVPYWTPSNDTKTIHVVTEYLNMDGGDGVDTLIVTTPFTDVDFGIDEGGYNFKTSEGGKITLNSVETIKFSDQTLSLDTSNEASDMLFFYEVFFNRSPDLEGITWWVDHYKDGASAKFIADTFTQSDEFSSLYGDNLSDADFINALYQNALKRAPDAEGLASWLQALETGSMSRGDIGAFFAQSTEIHSIYSNAIDDGIYLIV